MIRFASAVCLLALVVGSALSASGQGKSEAKPDKDYRLRPFRIRQKYKKPAKSTIANRQLEIGD